MNIMVEDSNSAREYNSYKGGEFYFADADLFNVIEAEEDYTAEVETEEKKEILPFQTQRELWSGINFTAFRNTNSDFIGIINIPFLKIWYPMVQNKEEDYNRYLSYSFNGDKNANGAIFLDYTFSRDFSDNHAIVFGHNMKNLSMFGSLHTLFDSEYKKPIYVYIYQPEQILVYEVFSAYN